MNELDYALTVTANRASTAAYYAVTPTPPVRIASGSVTLEPKSPSATLVNILPQVLEIQAPEGSVHAGVTIVTGDSHIDGEIVISPPVDVEVEVSLYGAGGERLDTYVVASGDGGGVFQFHVSADQAIPPGEVAHLLKRLIPQTHT
jgi:hypothetical protein